MEQMQILADRTLQIYDESPVSGKYDLRDAERIRLEMGKFAAFAGLVVLGVESDDHNLVTVNTDGERSNYSIERLGAENGTEGKWARRGRAAEIYLLFAIDGPHAIGIDGNPHDSLYGSYEINISELIVISNEYPELAQRKGSWFKFASAGDKITWQAAKTNASESMIGVNLPGPDRMQPPPPEPLLLEVQVTDGLNVMGACKAAKAEFYPDTGVFPDDKQRRVSRLRHALPGERKTSVAMVDGGIYKTIYGGEVDDPLYGASLYMTSQENDGSVS